jgi:hypothetical protein
MINPKLQKMTVNYIPEMESLIQFINRVCTFTEHQQKLKFSHENQLQKKQQNLTSDRNHVTVKMVTTNFLSSYELFPSHQPFKIKHPILAFPPTDNDVSRFAFL